MSNRVTAKNIKRMTGTPFPILFSGRILVWLLPFRVKLTAKTVDEDPASRKRQ